MSSEEPEISNPLEPVCAIEETWTYARGKITRKVRAGGYESKTAMRVGQLETRAKRDAATLRSIWENAELRGHDCEDVNGATNTSRPSLNIVDLFCGTGGFSLGVMRAIKAVGLRANFALAADIDRAALEVYSRNLRPWMTLSENLYEKVDILHAVTPSGCKFLGEPSLHDDRLATLRGKVDLLLAGPPCQGHSNHNNRTRRNDPRNILYLVPVSIGVALDAPVIVIENVPEVVASHQRVVQMARDLLESQGYHLQDCVLKGVKIGAPQTRKRHFLIASKTRKPPLNDIQAALHVENPRDIRWAIGDLMDSDGSEFIDKPADLSEENRTRIKEMMKRDLFEMPNELRPDCHRNGHTYPSIYGRLRWEEPSGTITSGFMSPGRGRYIHPELPRTLTIHEAARIQTFPDTFDFCGDGEPNKGNLCQWIGDAVPPLLGYAVGLAALASYLER